MRRIYFVLRWILLLIGGALFTTLFLVPMFYHRYNDHGVGEYYGIVRGRVFGYDPTSYLEIAGQSSASYRWTPPQTYVYDSLDLTIVTSDGRQLQSRLNVPEMTLTTDGTTERITERSFATLLLGPNAPADRANVALEIYAHLRSAGTGEFPPPRHHYYSFGNDDALIGGDIAHWSVGNRMPHLLLYWVVFWFVLLLLRVVRVANKSGGEP